MSNVANKEMLYCMGITNLTIREIRRTGGVLGINHEIFFLG